MYNIICLKLFKITKLFNVNVQSLSLKPFTLQVFITDPVIDNIS